MHWQGTFLSEIIPTTPPVLTKPMIAAHFMGSQVTYCGSHPTFHSSVPLMENLVPVCPPCYVKKMRVPCSQHSDRADAKETQWVSKRSISKREKTLEKRKAVQRLVLERFPHQPIAFSFLVSMRLTFAGSHHLSPFFSRSFSFFCVPRQSLCCSPLYPS